MIENVEGRQDNMKTQEGIGLYKIRYEMDVTGSTREQSYIAGVIAYTSKEAVETLVKFANARVKGFKGLKTEEVAFEGNCHAMSDAVKNAVLKTAVVEGEVVLKDEHEELLAAASKPKRGRKTSIIPKDKD